MSLPEEGRLAGVAVKFDMNVIGQVSVVKVVSAFPGEVVRVTSPVSGATVGQ